jgi:hypothetical protein
LWPRGERIGPAEVHASLLRLALVIDGVAEASEYVRTLAERTHSSVDDSTISRWFSGTVSTPRRANLEALVAARLAEELGSEVLSAPNLESRVKAVAAWVRSRQSRASLPDEEFTEALERRARATGAGALDPAAKSGVETAIMMTTEKGGGPTEEYFSGAGGFRKEGDIWREYPALPDGDHFEFKELRRDTEHIYLYDESRKRDERSPMYLRIPIGGGMVQWSYSNPLIWQDVCVVEPGTITDTTVQSPACECVAPQTSESDRE